MGQEQKQHVDLYRKILLRKRLLQWAEPKGAAYVPFIGDADIANELYRDRVIYGADVDAGRVGTARRRLGPTHSIITGDCNRWPFGPEDAATKARYGLADFDAYAYPYNSFRAWWKTTKRMPLVVLFFTDGEGQAIIRVGSATMPGGAKTRPYPLPLRDRRMLFNFWLSRHCMPWLANAVRPYEIVKQAAYKRGMMLYWGAVIKR